MAWIESHTVLLRHRKVIALAGELRLKPVWLIGHLHALWHTALEQQEDGDLGLWSDPMIADAACFQGGATLFVQQLQKHKWLDDRRIHDWLTYTGRYLRNKYAKRNKERLIEIWQKHGLSYGAESVLACQHEANTKPTPSQHQPNQPNLTNQPIQAADAPNGSNDPGYHPDKVPKAKEVIENYQSLTKRAHTAGPAAIRAVVGCLIDGSDPEELKKAAARYVSDCEKHERKTQGAIRFYEQGTYKDFLNGDAQHSAGADPYAEAEARRKQLLERFPYSKPKGDR